MRKIVAMFVMVFVMAIASETFALGAYPDYLGEIRIMSYAMRTWEQDIMLTLVLWL